MTSFAPGAGHHTPLRVVIAGGGVAALETLLALHDLAGRRVAVTMLAPDPEFVVRATTVGEPFEVAQGRRLTLTDVAAEHDAELVAGRLAGVDAGAGAVTTDTGRHLDYDALVIAAGAVPTETLPGALTFRGRENVDAMRAVLDELVAGTVRSVAFALPKTLVWPLPLYELALMTATHLAGRQVTGRRLTVVTPEPEPLDVFGPAGSREMRRMLRTHGIELRTAVWPEQVVDGGLLLAGDGLVGADRVVTLPVLRGPAVPGVPSDADGFLPVDRHGRVRGTRDVYAAGDVTAFPLKQGGLAAQQADAVAEAIAARAGAPIDPAPFRAVIRGLLLTGTQPLYLRAEPLSNGEGGAAVATPVSLSSSVGSDRPLWWPPAKIAGRYLAPYLATARPRFLGAATLADRPAPPVSAHSERSEALELALALADADADCGDYASALRALEAAESLEGALPPEYEHKREAWSQHRGVPAAAQT